MDFKYFCWLIIVFLLPKHWHIVGLPTTTNFRKEMWNVLQKVSSYIPEQHYFTLRDFILDMNGEMYGLKGMCEAHCNEKKELLNENKALDKKLEMAEKKYGDVCRAIKTRDWVLYLERDHFPHWLHYTDVSRYIKWMLALHFGEGHFFDTLRSKLKRDKIDYPTFAAGIHHIYKTSSLYPHNAPDIEKPKPEEAESFCKIFQKDHIQGATYACKVVIGIIPETSSEKSFTELIPYYPTRLQIVITGIKSAICTLQLLYGETKTRIENTPGFEDNKFVITNSEIIPGDPTETSDHAHRDKLDLPSMCFIVNMEMVLGSSGERLENTRKYVATKESIRGQLQSLFAKKNQKVEIHMIEDYRYITAIATLPPGIVQKNSDISSTILENGN